MDITRGLEPCWRTEELLYPSYNVESVPPVFLVYSSMYTYKILHDTVCQSNTLLIKITIIGPET